MDKRRVRYGVMLPDKDFRELFSIVQSSNGFILFIPNSGKHFTIINEEKTLSSHRTCETKNKHEHIGRLEKGIDLGDEEFIERLYHPRVLSEDEYSKPVVFMHEDWISYITGNTYEMRTVESEKDIIHYFDLEEIFRKAMEVIEKFQENPSDMLWVGKAEDLLYTDSEFALTEDQKIILEVEGELYELDTAPMNVMEEGNPLAEFLRPLGLPELLNDALQVFNNICDEID